VSIPEILSDENIKALLHIFNPQPDCTRIVGGAVRNALLGEPVHEIDFATKLQPQEVGKLGEQAGYRVVPTGIEFGTLTLIVNKSPYEITTLREDIETDGRHALVKFGTSWERDAARRDFTINALYLDAEGQIHAPVGGLDDLQARRVRFIGDPRSRICEDYLRIWRFFRFSAQYAHGEFDRCGLLACMQKREGLQKLSAERVKQELFKLLTSPRADEALMLMSESGLTTSLLGVQYLQSLRFLCESDQQEGRAPNALERLAALSVRLEEDAERLFRKLKLSRAEKQILGEIAQALFNLRNQPDEQEARVLLHRFPNAYESAIRIASRITSLGEPKGWESLLALPGVHPIPDFPLRGADLLILGAQPGSKLGEILKALEDDWIASDFSMTREDLLARYKKMSGDL
jgi:tRNA nucleotidyltransferase/poly(A) polymerase